MTFDLKNPFAQKSQSILSIVTSTWYDYFWFIKKPTTGISLSPVNSPDTSQEPNSVDSNTPEAVTVSPEPNASIQEYYKLQQELYVITLTITGIIFIFVWVFYSLNIALNYLIGATTSVVYLRMLAKDVERIGREQESFSKTRLAIFVGLIILATQLNQLKILPIFLGFLTYKAALIIYVLRTSIMPES